MRCTPFLALALSLVAVPLVARADLPPPPVAERMQTAKTKLDIQIDRSKVDLAGHKLEATLNHPAAKVRVKVVGVSGGVLAEVEKEFGGAAAGTALAVSWTPSSEEDVKQIEVYGYDTEGFWKGIAITPWSANIPHEEVNFETDSDVIRSSEAPKLDASLTKINDLITKNKDLGKITLYVAGHTDTVGTAEHNLQLSRRRAKAIASWFRGHGLKSPIQFEGVGKAGLAVKTADQVDERRNRRVEYILSLDKPPLPTGGDFSWQTP
jgi:outer membrane protein OmpA-like peptidoglycan-associated protein